MRAGFLPRFRPAPKNLGGHRMRFRKKPVEIEAVRWTGDNYAEVNHFAGSHFVQMDEDAEVNHFAGSHFVQMDEEDWANCNDPAATAQVLDVLHRTWVLVYDGDWIICGLKGEHYPYRPDVFAATYEAVEA